MTKLLIMNELRKQNSLSVKFFRQKLLLSVKSFCVKLLMSVKFRLFQFNLCQLLNRQLQFKNKIFQFFAFFLMIVSKI